MLKLHMEPVVEQYMVDLVVMSRQPSDIDDELASWISLARHREERLRSISRHVGMLSLLERTSSVPMMSKPLPMMC